LFPRSLAWKRCSNCSRGNSRAAHIPLRRRRTRSTTNNRHGFLGDCVALEIDILQPHLTRIPSASTSRWRPSSSASNRTLELASMRVLSLIGRHLKNREVHPSPWPPPIGFVARQLLSS
jgi:hypothetical protein